MTNPPPNHTFHPKNINNFLNSPWPVTRVRLDQEIPSIQETAYSQSQYATDKEDPKYSAEPARFLRALFVGSGLKIIRKTSQNARQINLCVGLIVHPNIIRLCLVSYPFNPPKEMLVDKPLYKVSITQQTSKCGDLICPSFQWGRSEVVMIYLDDLIFP